MGQQVKVQGKKSNEERQQEKAGLHEQQDLRWAETDIENNGKATPGSVLDRAEVAPYRFRCACLPLAAALLVEGGPASPHTAPEREQREREGERERGKTRAEEQKKSKNK